MQRDRSSFNLMKGVYHMAKKNVLHRNKDNVFNLFMLFVLFLILSLIVPVIGAGPSAPSYWISAVDFFTAIRTHFAAYWMFYSFMAVVIFTYFNKK